MTGSIFGDCPYPIREDLETATQRAWEFLGKPGNWWSGAERVDLVAETRAARDCEFCAERRDTLSPYAVSGEHGSATSLPSVVIEAVHRITTDAARLSEQAIQEVSADGLDDGRYVEIVSVVSTVLGIDSFCDALGLAWLPLPEAQPGEPSKYRPAEARPDVGWVPMIPSGENGSNEADIFAATFVPNVFRAMSLVPDAVRNLRRLSAYYVQSVGDTSLRTSLDRPQIELIAARVSALNECFY